MGWTAIIAALISLFGPMIVEWLQKKLKEWLARAAKDQPSPEGMADAVAVSLLFDRAIMQAPKFAFARRAFLRVMKRRAVKHADAVIAAAKNPNPAEVPTLLDLSPEEKAEIVDAGQAVPKN